MILGFDVGNTHIVPVFYSYDGNIKASFRIPTSLSFTEESHDSVFHLQRAAHDSNLAALLGAVAHAGRVRS